MRMMWNHLQVQDWQPTTCQTDGALESQEDSQENQPDTEAIVPEESHDDTPGPSGNPEPSILSQKLFEDEMEFEMNKIYDSLEQSLPVIPLPTPAQPQLLAEMPKEVEQAETPRAPVPTPCRVNTPTGSTDTKLKSLKAYEDRVWKVYMHAHKAVCFCVISIYL